MMGQQPVEIFTDGACRGNPGPGGWGVLMRYAQQEKHIFGGEAHTTNNRMELQAVIKALEALKKNYPVIITTDSQYVRNGIMQWVKNWKRNGWRTANKAPVKNIDLWQMLEALSEKYSIQWVWVKGHSGHRENEIADQLANQAIDELLEKNLK